MAFVTLDSNNLEVGDPVTTDILTQIKSNSDDHETRVALLEGGASKVQIVNELVLNAGQYVSTTTFQGLVYWKADRAFTLTQAKVAIFTSGSSGTLEIDMLKSSTIGGVYTTVFSTKPSLAFGAGNNIESSNAVFSTTAISQGDYLRIDITSFQAPQNKFLIQIFGEV